MAISRWRRSSDLYKKFMSVIRLRIWSIRWVFCRFVHNFIFFYTLLVSCRPIMEPVKGGHRMQKSDRLSQVTAIHRFESHTNQLRNERKGNKIPDHLCQLTAIHSWLQTQVPLYFVNVRRIARHCKGNFATQSVSHQSMWALCFFCSKKIDDNIKTP